MTIKKARELCKERNNRLPRIGHEMLITETVENIDIRGTDDRVRNGDYAVSYWLQNISGKFRVYKSVSAFPVNF